MIHTAQALRLVRRAQVDFLLNWTRDQAETPRPAGRMTDLLSAAAAPESDRRDWTHLYDGSVLDD